MHSFSPSFWDSLPHHFVALAPMDGVTDAPFRSVYAQLGKPAYTVTEFTAVEGIRAGALRLLDDLAYSEEHETIVVAQLFGADPLAFFGAAAVSAALGFDGVDINMGCPAKNVTQHGAGASLILDPPRAREIVRQTYAGIQAWSEGRSLESLGVHPDVCRAVEERRKGLSPARQTRRILPVSVKTRIGYNSNELADWIPHLIAERPRTITIHGRTLKQLYSGLADWDAIAGIAPLISEAGILVVGNGDCQSLEEAHQRCRTAQVDGILIGRASFGNPWIFDATRTIEPTPEERIATARMHAIRHWDTFGERGYLRMRKHLLDYARGFDGASELRVRLSRVQTIDDTLVVLDSSYPGCRAEELSPN